MGVEDRILDSNHDQFLDKQINAIAQNLKKAGGTIKKFAQNHFRIQ
jgi:hypothetical protein